MSKSAKILWLITFLALVVTVVVKFLTNAWLNLNTVLVVIAAAAAAAAVVMDFRLYWDFFTMRTTKHGMNMGVMIVLMLTGLVCVNYLANKHNKTWDVTEEKINSLSDQTTKLLDELKGDLTIQVFFKGSQEGGQKADDKQRIKQDLLVYQEYSNKVKPRYHNAYIDQDLALEYLKDLGDRDQAPVYVFVEYNGHRIRAEEPFDESSITSAMIKATREGETKIYFIKGHGERDLDSDGDQGLKDFAKTLADASFKTEGLSLIDRKEIPADAAAIAIVGPSVPYLDSELGWLRSYMEKGGRLFIALDPGQRQNLANLTKTLGVEFENNYVVTLAPVVGGGPATILGRTFDMTSDITRSFPTGSSFAVFPLVSEVKPAPGKAADLDVKEIVKSDSFGFTVNDITKPVAKPPQTRPVTLAVSVSKRAEEKKPEADAKKDEGKKNESRGFEAVVFGDSDFISNRGLMLGVNRDLGINAFAHLANQTDLLSIRPKFPKGTNMVLTGFEKFAIIVLSLSLPVILLIFSGVIWFRRRGA